MMITIKGKQALADYFHVAYSTINTNFPKFVAKQLAQGIQITKQGVGQNAVFTIEEVEPQLVDKSVFSSRKIEIAEPLPGEIWVSAFERPAYEVSNLGRLRRKKDKTLIHGTLNSQGYLTSELNQGNKILHHRLILQSFEPREDWQDLTVDHLNGIRSDNRLENLHWVEMEENARAMMQHRAELQKELTRIIQHKGYDETLAILRAL